MDWTLSPVTFAKEVTGEEVSDGAVCLMMELIKESGSHSLACGRKQIKRRSRGTKCVDRRQRGDAEKGAAVVS